MIIRHSTQPLPGFGRSVAMAFYISYSRAANGRATPKLPLATGWHTEVFISERDAMDRGCELIEHGIAIIKLAPLDGDPLDGIFIPLDALGLHKYRDCCRRSYA